MTPMRAIGLAVALTAVVGCTKDAPGFCCLTLEDCESFGVDHVRECEGEQVCQANQCVPSPDASQVDGPSVDANNACISAGGQIAFQTNRDGDDEIALMLADGTGYQQLTLNTWIDRAPQLSPDGTLIAWFASPAGQFELYVMGSDGSNPHSVSDGPVTADRAQLRWSPDSSRLLFLTNRDGNNEIYGVAFNGTGLANLTNNSAFEDGGDWSPDASKIVFRANRNVPYADIYVMNADGSGQAPITTSTSSYLLPRWSPFATQIAHTRPNGTTQTELWTMTVSGGAPHDLGVGDVSHYAWSPDGSAIAFETAPDVYTISATGTGLDNVTNGAGTSSLPQWSPDGARLLIESDRDRNPELYVVSASDGSQSANVTNDPGSDVSGSWSPCP